MKCRKQYYNNKPKLESTCIECDSIFQYAYDKRRERRFCGRSCASKYYIKNGTFDVWRKRVNPRQERYPIACHTCSREKWVLKRVLDEYTQGIHLPFCSVRCRAIHLGKLSHQRAGKFKMPDEANQRRLATLMKNHNVSHPYALAKHRKISKAAQQLYDFLSLQFPDYNFQLEKLLVSNNLKKNLFLDIVSFEQKIAVEFNGDYWHCNPECYAENYFHSRKKKTAQEIWIDDARRIESIQKEGYNVIVVWEKELSKNNWQISISQRIEEACRRKKY